MRVIRSLMDLKQATVLVTRSDIPESAIKLLEDRLIKVHVYEGPKPIPRGEFLNHSVGKDGVFCMLSDVVDKVLLDTAGPQLKVIGTMSVGFEHIDVDECKKRNIVIGYTPGVLTDAVADLTLGLLLMTTRRLQEAANQVTLGTWGSWSPLWMCGRGLTGSTVGIVGLGRIGTAVAKRLLPFNVKRLLYCGRNPKVNDVGAEFVSFHQLLAESDFVIALCSVNDDNKGLFNKDAFSRMKSTAAFINVSRGALVDQDALYEALTTGQIRAAGLDVTTPEPLPPDHPLVSLDNCVILPHIGSADIETRTIMAELTARNIIAGLEGTELPTQLKI